MYSFFFDRLSFQSDYCDILERLPAKVYSILRYYI